MSINRSSSHTRINTELTCGAAKRSLPESQDLNNLNKKLKRLTENVLPESPYLLTVPTDVPFRLGSRFVSNWAVGEGRPFAPGEEHLQYMTFLSHQGEDSLLVAVGGWSDGNGNVMEEDESKPVSNASASSTPLSGGPPKKKISLNEYKNKSREATTTQTPVVHRSEKNENGPTEPKEAASAPKPTRQEQNALGKSKLYKPKDISLPPKPPPPQSSANGGAGARKKLADERAQESRPSTLDKQMETSPKRRRLSPPPKITTNRTSTSSGKNNSTSVPRLLSPTLPPATSSCSFGLPKLLSPTLPPDIEAELTKLSNEPTLNPASSNHGGNASGHTSASKSDNPTTKTSGTLKHHSGSSSSSNNKLHSSASPKLSSSTTKLSGQITDKDALSRKSNKLSKPAEKQSPSTTKPRISSSTNLSSGVKLSRIVKLRYGRANRKRVEALLKFSGKRKADGSVKQVTTQDLEFTKKKDCGPDGGQSASKPSENDHIRSACARGEKRPRASDDHDKADHAAKRPKASTNSNVPEKSRSPGPTGTPKSPSRPGNSTTSKSTPKKDLKSAAMRRVESADSDVKTPSGLGTGTPGSIEKCAKPSSSTLFDNQNNKPRDLDWRAWREEFQKYAGLGRDLKHASSRQAQHNPPGANEKLGAATAVEAIICFILAFVADNQQKALTRQTGDSTTWRSILPYWNAVKHLTSPYPQLHGLCLLLGAVSHDTIHGIDLERLSSSALPCDHNPIPTPGSDGNTVLSDEGKKYKKEFLDLKARLSDHYKEAHRLWLEGNRELPDDVLARDFPKTWSKRSRNFSVRGKQKLKIGEYNCEMFLPLGRTTTPIEAVCFGWSLLNEWCEKEGVRWAGRLGL